MNKEDLRDGLFTGLIIGVVVGLVAGLFYGLVDGLVIGLFAGLVLGLVAGLVLGLVAGLVVGLVAGVVVGLTLISTSQLIGYFSSNPEFNLIALVLSGIGLLLVQLIGWSYYFKLNNEVNE